MVNFTEIVGDDVETIEVSNEDLNTTVPFKYCSKFIEDLEQPLELQLVKNLKFWQERTPLLKKYNYNST